MTWHGADESRDAFNPFVRGLLDAAVAGADEKLSVQTVVLDLRGLVDSFDALVLATGRNDRQVRAIADQIEYQVAEQLGIRPLRSEGWTSAEWVALDYGDVIVHIFDEPSRDYYDLEHLWNAAPSMRTTPTR